ncbi:MAG: hypothetical protein DDT42_02115 [candidate division WS2 bacterium]|uniref:Uncharacterized protein n=1 Tax=Psychracetigena formicireducens TaxID=2986056 RepID=A0A9E2F834_PSYF1|nr:hypothetical protein [Candidatus Psychracetigena formicireducens]
MGLVFLVSGWTTGILGATFGGGGSGGASVVGAGNIGGAAGASGVIIITEYF